ncbi:MAG: ParA family protein [Desulfobacter sp.]|nr:ParA family protein [Desulfobacter sp.]
MNAKTIVVCNQKGGPGKTTVSMQLAGTLGLKNKVLVIDADPQGTSLRWFSMADEELPFPATVVSLSEAGDKVHQGIKRFISDYEYIIVDCPPADNSPIPRSALLVADLAVIPVRPSPLDLWATLGIKKTIEDVSVINETLKSRLLLNQCQPNLTLTKDILEVLPQIKMERLNSILHLRTAYSKSASEGTTVHHVSGSSEKAIEEINNVAREIIELLNS